MTKTLSPKILAAPKILSPKHVHRWAHQIEDHVTKVGHPFFSLIEAWWRGERRPRRVVEVVASLRCFCRRDFVANPEYGAGCGSDTNFRRSLLRAVVKADPMAAGMPESPRYYVATVGSVPSMAGGERAHPRLRPHPTEKAYAKMALTVREAGRRPWMRQAQRPLCTTPPPPDLTRLGVGSKTGTYVFGYWCRQVDSG